MKVHAVSMSDLACFIAVVELTVRLAVDVELFALDFVLVLYAVRLEVADGEVEVVPVLLLAAAVPVFPAKLPVLVPLPALPALDVLFMLVAVVLPVEAVPVVLFDSHTDIILEDAVRVEFTILE
jgi:hypothetical protein